MQRWKLKIFFKLFPWQRVGCGVVLLSVFLFYPFPKRRQRGQRPTLRRTGCWRLEATNHLGRWIWDANSFDKQTVRFWRAFEIPAGAKISHDNLRLTVDNGCTLFLDGTQIGRGSDWRTVPEYDLTQLLDPGHHVLEVEAFNDRLEGGLIVGMEIEMPGRPAIQIVSDTDWKIVPDKGKGRWVWPKKEAPDWRHAVVVGVLPTPPWIISHHYCPVKFLLTGVSPL